MGEFLPVEILTATMSDAPAAAAAPAKAKAPAKPRAKPTHPKTSEMVVAAIKALKERTGSSLAAIKKYIAANYKVDIVKLAPFIRKALKKGVESKQLVMVKASYKLSKEAKVEKKPKKKVVKKKKPAAKKAKTPKKAAAKKAKTPKKAAKKPAAKKPAAKKPAAKKSPKKAAAKKPAAKKPAAKKPAAKKAAKK